MAATFPFVNHNGSRSADEHQKINSGCRHERKCSVSARKRTPHSTGPFGSPTYWLSYIDLAGCP